MGRKIIIKDKKTEVIDCINAYEAVGLVYGGLQNERIQKAIDYLKDEIKKFQPIEGEIVINDGGEWSINDFTSPYEALGFVVSKCAQENRTQILKDVSSQPPEKYRERIVAARVEKIVRVPIPPEEWGKLTEEQKNEVVEKKVNTLGQEPVEKERTKKEEPE